MRNKRLITSFVLLSATMSIASCAVPELDLSKEFKEGVSVTYTDTMKFIEPIAEFPFLQEVTKSGIKVSYGTTSSAYDSDFKPDVSILIDDTEVSDYFGETTTIMDNKTFSTAFAWDAEVNGFETLTVIIEGDEEYIFTYDEVLATKSND